MENAEKGRNVLPLLLVLAGLSYFLLAARPLGSEPGCAPRWVLDAASAPDSAAAQAMAASDVLSFRSGGRFGFFSTGGSLLGSRVGGQELALAADGSPWAEYPSPHEEAVFRSVAGAELFRLTGTASPFYASGRLFSLTPDGAGLSAFGAGGAVAWSRDLPSIMTAFSASVSEAAAGCLDGNLVVVGADGSELFTFKPGGSRLSVILGIALSPDGGRLAVVSGIDPQRFLLFERRQRGYALAYHRDLPSAFRRRVQLSFSSDGELVLLEQEGRIEIIGHDGRLSRSFSHPGRLLDLLPGAAGGYHVIRTSTGRAESLLAFSSDGKGLIGADLPSDTFLTRKGDSLFLGSGDRLARIDIVED